MVRKRSIERVPPMIEQIQEAIRESGRTLGELGRESGVSSGQLSRFVRNERFLSLPAAAKLCDVLGLQLVKPERPAEAAQPGPSDKPARSPRKPKK